MAEVDKFPGWRYGPNGQSAIFESEADVPTGWQDHPSKVTKAPKAPAPVKAAQAKGAAPAKAPAKKRGRKAKPKPAPLDL